MNNLETMAIAYTMGRVFGLFIGGCFFGLIPLIVGIVKKRTGTGVSLMITCGCFAWANSLISLPFAIISGIVLGCMKAERPEAVEGKKPQIHVPEHGGWICPKCGLVHDKEIEICFHCRTPRKDATKFI